MRMHARLIGLAATTLVAATTLANIPNDPTQVQPLAVGTRAPNPQYTGRTAYIKG